jgi:hypothetical protein
VEEVRRSPGRRSRKSVEKPQQPRQRAAAQQQQQPPPILWGTLSLTALTAPPLDRLAPCDPLDPLDPLNQLQPHGSPSITCPTNLVAGRMGV